MVKAVERPVKERCISKRVALIFREKGCSKREVAMVEVTLGRVTPGPDQDILLMRMSRLNNWRPTWTGRCGAERRKQ
jgi:hypothetical protein